MYGDTEFQLRPWISANNVENINTAKSQQKSRKVLVIHDDRFDLAATNIFYQINKKMK